VWSERHTKCKHAHFVRLAVGSCQAPPVQRSKAHDVSTLLFECRTSCANGGKSAWHLACTACARPRHTQEAQRSGRIPMIHSHWLVPRVQRSLCVLIVATGTARAMVACGDDSDENNSSPRGRGGSAGISNNEDASSAGTSGNSGAGGVGTSGTNGGLDAQSMIDSSLDAGNSDATTPAQDASDARDAGDLWTNLCKDRGGSPLSYDYSRGLAGEYAFELVMNCDLAGYMSALVDADPVNLTQVEGYVGELTDWYRATVLRCAEGDATTALDTYGLVPASQSAGMSAGDFRGTVKLFISVLDRHDALPDGLSSADKAEVERRLMSFRERAVENVSDAFTRPTSVPDCIPSPSLDGGLLR
jgi:hypothetical protein